MMASKRTADTPVRSIFLSRSSVRLRVCNGLGALSSSDRNLLAARIRTMFGDSLDLDRAFAKTHPQENRWDYLLGCTASGEVIGVEPHSAKMDEISTVIAKKRAAQEQLSGHLRAGGRVRKWFWVSTGKARLTPMEKAKRQLDQAGIEFVGGCVLPKHLPKSTRRSSTKK